MRINREAFLQKLSRLRPGLTTKGDTIEQSSCVLFKGGTMATFNGEVAVRSPTPKGLDFEGAVPAKKLLDNLEKWAEEEVDVLVDGGKLLIKGDRKVTTTPLFDAKLDLSVVGTPAKWVKLPPEFLEAVRYASSVAGKNEQKFETTCVHIMPKVVESSDGRQRVRYSVSTGSAKSTLIRAEAARAVADLDASACGDSEKWLHWRNPAGLIISARKFSLDYPDFGTLVEGVKGGHKLDLPKGLEGAAQRAGIYAAANGRGERITVEIVDGKKGKLIRVRGEADDGTHTESRDLKGYKGPNCSFAVAADLLADAVKRHADCALVGHRLRANGPNYVYLISLATKEGKGDAKAKDKGKGERS